MPFLSVIVPVYNVESYIKKCIDSILQQTFTDFELIIVDDGSPDSCPSICDEYKNKDNRVKVIHKNNSGLVSARKTGLSIAQGKYIGYVDSDDWIDKDMYFYLCEAAKDTEADIIICDVIHSFKDREIKYKQYINPGFYDKGAMKSFIYPKMLYSGVFFKFGLHPALWNKIFKRELLESNQTKVNDIIRIGEDVACVYPCLLDAENVYLLEDKYLYYYRQNENSMTSNYDSKFLERILILNNFLLEMNNEKKIFDLSLQINYYFLYLIIKSIDNEFINKNKKSKKEILVFLEYLYSIDNIYKTLNNKMFIELPVKIKLYKYLLCNNHKKLLINIIYFYRKLKSKKIKVKNDRNK